MLVLSRKKMQQIILHQGGVIIKISVVEIKGDQVKIGVEAPVAWGVDREEVYRAKKELGNG